MKQILLVIPLAFSLSVYAQNHSKIEQILEAKKQEVLQKQLRLAPLKKVNLELTTQDYKLLDTYLKSNNILISPEEFITQELDKEAKEAKVVSAFIGKTPIYEKVYDVKANKAANVDYLYNGQVGNITTPVTGKDINITIVDGGGVINHQEFTNTADRIKLIDIGEKIISGGQVTNDTIGYHYHSTEVAGVMGAAGITDSARGVLQQTKFRSYSFSTTEKSGNYFQKTLASEYKLSNHSYGTNLGYSASNFIAMLFGIVTYPLPIEPLTDGSKTYSGTYFTSDYNWDLLVDSEPNHIIVKSAGNSFGDNATNVVLGTPKSFSSIDIDGKSYSKKIGEVNDSTTIRLDALPTGNCELEKACIDFGSLAKNIITVGAIDHLKKEDDYRYTTADKIQYSNYSSAGPRKDGAIKPDVSTVGTNVYMPTINSKDANDMKSYKYNSGTSFSSPLVAGVIGALVNFQRLVKEDETIELFADEAKNLITHTAQESGLYPGPDVFAGWGVIDAKAAADLLLDASNDEAKFERFVFKNGDKITYEVYGKEKTPLKASISWIDPAANIVEDDGSNLIYERLVNDNANKLVNDFDLRVIDTETNQVYYPWKLDADHPRSPALKGDNTVDNTEQVLVENPIADRKYRIEISHKGNLVNHDRKIEDRAISFILSGYSNTSLGISELDNSKEILVYPTKTKGYVTIKNIDKNASIELFNMAGQKMKSNVTAGAEIKVNLNGLVNGVYILNIYSNGKTISKKVLKY